MHLPTKQAPTKTSGASDNSQSEINLRVQNEVIEILGRPIFPKEGGARPAATRPSILLSECAIAPEPPGRPGLLRAISGRPPHALGENWPENARGILLGRRTSAWQHTLGLAKPCECPHPIPAKMHSARWTPSSPTPANPRLRGSHSWCYTMGPGPSQSPGSNARLLPQPSASGVLSLVALHIGSPDSHYHASPNDVGANCAFGLTDHIRSEIKLCAQNEIIPILGRPIFPKDGGARPATSRSSTLLPERSTAPAPPGGPRLFRAISRWPQHALGEKGPWAMESRAIRRAAQRRPILMSFC